MDSVIKSWPITVISFFQNHHFSKHYKNEKLLFFQASKRVIMFTVTKLSFKKKLLFWQYKKEFNGATSPQCCEHNDSTFVKCLIFVCLKYVCVFFLLRWRSSGESGTKPGFCVFWKNTRQRHRGDGKMSLPECPKICSSSSPSPELHQDGYGCHSVPASAKIYSYFFC